MTRKPAAKKAAKKKPAAKKRAAKRPPEPEIQVNRVTDTATKPENETPPKSADASAEERDENGETQADRDAAGEAIRSRTRGRNDLAQYEQVHEPLEHANFDHHAAEEKRQAELARARELHNRNTAGFATS